MPKKLSKNIDYFEDYRLLSIVSNLKDYSLCFHINSVLKLDLVKYDDLIFDFSSGPEMSFSWYYYHDPKSSTAYYLMGNKSEGSLLLSSQKTMDYFLLIKDVLNDDIARNYANSLRKISGVSAIFNLNVEQIKEMEHLLESIELHELEVVRKS